MKLNDLVNEIDELKKRLPPKDAKLVGELEFVTKHLYLQVRHLAERRDLTMWYNQFAIDTINNLDVILEARNNSPVETEGEI